MRNACAIFTICSTSLALSLNNDDDDDEEEEEEEEE